MGEPNCCCEEHAQGRGVGIGNHDPETPTVARCCRVHRRVPRVDLVKQLRMTMDDDDLCDEAADEIEWLRDHVGKMASMIRGLDKIARAATHPERG